MFKSPKPEEIDPGYDTPEGLHRRVLEFRNDIAKRTNDVAEKDSELLKEFKNRMKPYVFSNTPSQNMLVILSPLDYWIR